VNVDNPIRHLEVCAGLGGFSLGLQLALGDGVRTVGYIEREAFPAAVLLARMADESLERAPVFCGGLEDVDGRELRGEVDLITAGFPCQPYSVAGKRLGAADKRAIWPNIARLIAAVEPSAVLLENVSLNAFREPWRDLRELGFELAPPVQIGACHVGAPHRRLRYFALAYRNGWRCQSLWQSQLSGVESSRGRQLDGRGDDGRLEGEKADTERDTERDRQQWRPRRRSRGVPDQGNPESVHNGKAVADTGSAGLQGGEQRPPLHCDGVRSEAHGPASELRGSRVSEEPSSVDPVPGLRELPLQHPPGEARPRMHMSPGGGLGDQPIPTYPPGPEGDWATVPAELHPATAEPELRGVADGVPGRMDRLRSLGNAVLPQVVAAAWRELTR